MIKKKELSTMEYESIEKSLNKVLGTGSLESIKLKYKLNDGDRAIYTKSKYRFDTELFVGLIKEDALDSGYRITDADEYILVYDEVDFSNDMIKVSHLSIEEVCELPFLIMIVTHMEYSFPEYVNRICEEYYKYFAHELINEDGPQF